MEVYMSLFGSFTDCHCHAFWDLDDGVQTKEEALLLLRCAQKNGISEIFVTPHLISGGLYEPNISIIKDKLESLIRLRDEYGLTIRLKYGSEFRINDQCFGAIATKSYICYQNTNWILVEFTRGILDSKIIEESVMALKKQGINILIAHPERYFDSEKLAVEYCKHWHNLGCFLQINRTSLNGYHGVRADKISWRLISEGLAHIVASDAHQGEGRRECRIDDVYGMIERRIDKSVADTLCIINPRNLSMNQDFINIHVKRAWYKREVF
jgi:protein-tyrosine phosphatase